MKNELHPSLNFIKYLHISNKDIKSTLMGLFDITITDEDIINSTYRIPVINEETTRSGYKKLCQKYDCSFILESKSILMKFTKNKKKMFFINTAILRGVKSEHIVEIINSNFTDLEEFMLYTLKEVETYKAAIMNLDICNVDSISNFRKNNPTLMEWDEEVDIAEVIFNSGLNIEGDLSKMMNEIAMLSIIKTKKLIKKEDETSLNKATKLMSMGSKAIDIKNKIDEINKNNLGEDGVEKILIEFDKSGVTRPKLRREIE